MPYTPFQLYELANDDTKKKVLKKLGPAASKFLADYEAYQANRPTIAESAGRAAEQTVTFGHGDELRGAAGVVADKPWEGLGAAPQAGGYGAREMYKRLFGPPMMDTYRGGRDKNRSDNAEARAENPLTYGATELGTGVGMALLPIPGSGVTSAAGKIAVGTGTGAAAGAASALGHSETDLTKGGDASAEMLQGAGVGALLGGGGATAGQLVGGAMRKLKPKAGEAANSQAFKALHPSLAAFRGVDEGLQQRVGRMALDEDIVTMGAGAKSISERTSVLRKQAGEEIGRIVEEVDREALAKGIHLNPDQLITAAQQRAAARYGLAGQRKLLQAIDDELGAIREHYNYKRMSNKDLRSEKTEYQDKSVRGFKDLESDKGLAYGAVGAELKESLLDNAKKVSPKKHGELTQANKRFEELATADDIAADAYLQAEKNGVLGLRNITSGAVGGIPGAVTSHFFRSRGNSTAAASLEMLERLLGKDGAAQLMLHLSGQAGAINSQAESLE